MSEIKQTGLRDVLDTAMLTRGWFTLKDVAGVLEFVVEELLNDITDQQRRFVQQADDDEAIKDIVTSALDVLDTANAMRLE